MKLTKIGKITVVVLVVLSLIGLAFAIKALDDNVEKKAIAKCGGKNNIVKQYTSTAEVYYTCKEV